jgi:hypothetical protein
MEHVVVVEEDEELPRARLDAGVGRDRDVAVEAQRCSNGLT